MKEIRRYVYQRSGTILSIVQTDTLPIGLGDPIVLMQKKSALLKSVPGIDPTPFHLLDDQEFRIQTVHSGVRKILIVCGGTDVSALYGAYRFAEALGVRFYLHGDVIPDGQVPFQIPELNETHTPLFRLRGIQPFHDFPEGPDWWNADDYMAILAQLPKLRMNFFGLHTYPEGGPNAEPTVWIGLKKDVNPDGTVQHSYPSSYQNTLRGNWGYMSMVTTNFHYGASLLFEENAYGSDVMRGYCYQPTDAAGCNEVFNRAGKVLNRAFTFGRELGIQTCVGTETPLTVPQEVQKRLRNSGKDPQNLKTIQSLYEGLFCRIAQTFPIDCYWFWTPEGWTWQDASSRQIQETLNDLSTAIRAARNVQVPFKLATCGWVLGPPSDRDLFARELPKDVTVSCINREVGKAPVDPAFARVVGRSKWAIPWLEDDPSLTSPQLWAGRMRKDAADAAAYGCDGLFGIHWRTRIISPNVAALAQAAWDTSLMRSSQERTSEPGPVGGVWVSIPDSLARAEAIPAVYQTVRDKVSGYRFQVPNGTYRVTLQFLEFRFEKNGSRIFDVFINGKKAAEKLDIFARIGLRKPYDMVLQNITVTNGLLQIDLIDRIHYPCIAGIVIQGNRFTKKINCGGMVCGDYETDLPETPRALPSGRFYRDWALNQFGPGAADTIASLFQRLDGKFPIPSDWVNGPGGLARDSRPWPVVEKDFVFTDELKALRPKIKGTGSMDRFDYWLHQFEYAKEIAHLKCLWDEFYRAPEKFAHVEGDSVEPMIERYLMPIRKKMVQSVRQIFGHLLATVGNTGEMGTIANWEQHILPDVILKPESLFKFRFGKEMPADLKLSGDYSGPLRIVVPTVRTSLKSNEPLKLKVILLTNQTPAEAFLYWRPLGEGPYQKIALAHVAAGVYTVTCPATETDFEYCIRAKTRSQTAVFPVTAPKQNQTVVVYP